MARIGIDVDGVLADFATFYTDLTRTLFGISLPNPPPTWTWNTDFGLTSRMAQQVERYIKGQAKSFLNVPAYAHTHELIAKMNAWRDAGHDIYSITARNIPRAKWITEKWLMGQGLTLPTVIVASEKGAVARALKLDAFVDDHAENCLSAQMCSPGTTVIMLEALHNHWAAVSVRKNGGMVLSPRFAMVAIDVLVERKAREVAAREEEATAACA